MGACPWGERGPGPPEPPHVSGGPGLLAGGHSCRESGSRRPRPPWSGPLDSVPQARGRAGVGSAPARRRARGGCGRQFSSAFQLVRPKEGRVEGLGEGPLTPEPLPAPAPQLPRFWVWLTTRPPRFLAVAAGTAPWGSPVHHTAVGIDPPALTRIPGGLWSALAAWQCERQPRLGEPVPYSAWGRLVTGPRPRAPQLRAADRAPGPTPLPSCKAPLGRPSGIAWSARCEVRPCPAGPSLPGRRDPPGRCSGGSGQVCAPQPCLPLCEAPCCPV